MHTSSAGKIFQRMHGNFSRIILHVLLLFLPAFFIPGMLGAPNGAPKMFFFGVGTIIATLFWVIEWAQKQKIVLRTHLAAGALLVWWGSVLFSAIFSTSPRVSLLGGQFGIDSLLGFSLLALLALLFMQSDESDGLSFLRTVSFSVFPWLLFEGAIFLLGGIGGLSSRSLWGGTLSHASVYLGMIVLLSSILLQAYTVRSFSFITLAAVSAVALLSFLVLASHALTILLFGILLFWLAVLFVKRSQSRAGALIPLIIVCILGASLLGWSHLSSLQRPFLQTVPKIIDAETSAAATQTFAESLPRALFGSGPGTFAYQWLRYSEADSSRIDPDLIEEVKSSFAVLLVTGGFMGLFSMLIFCGVFFWTSLQTGILRPTSSVLFALLPAGYLLASGLLSSIDSVAVISLFVCIGLTLSFMVNTESTATPLVYAGGGVAIFGYCLAVLLCVSGWYFGATEYGEIRAFFESKKSFASFNQGGTEVALPHALQAVASSHRDIYARQLSELYRIQAVSQRGNFEENIAAAIGAAEWAVRLNTTDFRNWQMLGKAQALEEEVYGSSGNNARQSYERARALNPHDAVLLLERAHISLLQHDRTEALQFAELSLQLRPTYREAKEFIAAIE